MPLKPAYWPIVESTARHLSMPRFRFGYYQKYTETQQRQPDAAATSDRPENGRLA